MITMTSMRSAVAGRLGFRLLLCLILLCSTAGGGAVSEGQPHCDHNDGSVSVSGSAMDMVHCRRKGLAAESERKSFFLETNIVLPHHLHTLKTIVELSHHLGEDIQSLRGSLSSMDAQNSETSEIEAAQAELHAGRLATTRTAVDAGMARVEATYRSLGDVVDRLRETTQKQKQKLAQEQLEIQHALDHLIHNFQSQLEEVRPMRANLSAALDRPSTISSTR